jgi:hypothetical protein
MEDLFFLSVVHMSQRDVIREDNACTGVANKLMNAQLQRAPSTKC